MENSSFTTEEITEGLFRFIDNSPTAFHAVQNAARMLAVSYTHLSTIIFTINRRKAGKSGGLR